MRRKLDCRRYIDQGDAPMRVDDRLLHFHLSSYLPVFRLPNQISLMLGLGDSKHLPTKDNMFCPFALSLQLIGEDHDIVCVVILHAPNSYSQDDLSSSLHQLKDFVICRGISCTSLGHRLRSRRPLFRVRSTTSDKRLIIFAPDNGASVDVSMQVPIEDRSSYDEGYQLGLG